MKQIKKIDNEIETVRARSLEAGQGIKEIVAKKLKLRDERNKLADQIGKKKKK